MLRRKHRQDGGMKGMLMLLAAMLVGWATLAAPTLAAPSDNASISLEGVVRRTSP
jgi:hypothetical protein